MPRRPRVALPEVPLHLIQRGNNRQACFFAEEDYAFYLDHLAEQAIKQGCRVHAYCLMTNHVHLLVTPLAEGSVGALMKAVGQRYVQYVNRTYRRSGTLWEGRFRSCVLQDDAYLLACSRYIEMNPVRAGMVVHPGDYRWSSYRANGQGRLTRWWCPMLSIRLWGRSPIPGRLPTGSRSGMGWSRVWWTRFGQRQMVITPWGTAGLPGRWRRL